MSDETLSFSIPLDEEGFVTLKCPYCGEGFKVLSTIVNDESIIELFCPYCGLVHESNEFFQPDIIEQAKILAYNNILRKIDEEFEKLERQTKNNKYMQFKKGKDIDKLGEKELIEPNALQNLIVPCCNTEIKMDITNSVAYCPICGGIIDATNRD
ncbi:hypothetical protein [Clostridium beijerinckii]|uniref:hypothetical protein n=1 Tax=Clostridium beijerinckii TaxID=1520 RepID=UPI00080A03B5|nr:hypothetical protein [Clostridium beijerinckii]OCA97242.1 hypothetical protein BGS1_21300 [Clostridium beijerinckii]